MRRGVVTVLALLVLVPFGGSAVWNGASNTLERELVRSTAAPPEMPTGAADLPAPVARFLAHTFPPGQLPIRAAQLEQAGEFLLNGEWKPFTAHQVFTSAPPSFMWDARISIAPLVSVYVRDAYIRRSASMRARVMAVRTVVDARPSPELASGALMRYLGEAVWFPTRLVPGRGLTWTGVDDTHAEATLVDGDTTVSLRFTFDDSGAVTEVYSPARYREVNGSYVKTPWRVRAMGQEVLGGVRLMSPAEAEWVMPEGPQPYWRGRVTHVQYSY
ncbi:MAG: DUF6544 family protein [Vicinamibacterales bacterium]